MTDNRNNFSKEEKLTEKIFIDALFEKGYSISGKNFRLLFGEPSQPQSSTVRILIAVPKKHLKHAVQRNRMKRLIREVYRLNKKIIIEHYKKKQKKCHIAIIYTGKNLTDYKTTYNSLIYLFKKLTLT